MGINKKDFVILCASRAIKSKGWHELCEAVISLNITNLKVIFAGSGPILVDIKSKYSINKNLKFLGFSNKITELISLSDIICLPSYNEGLPTILIESITHYKPVLATNVGSTSSIVENKDGKCGVLIPPNKGRKLVEELKSKIIYFLNGQTSFKKAPFETAKEIFSVKKMTENYLKYFNS